MRNRKDSRGTKGNVSKLGWALKSSASFVLVSIFLYISITVIVLSFAYLTGNQALIPLLLYLYTYLKWACIVVLMGLSLLLIYTLLGIFLYTIWGDESH